MRFVIIICVICVLSMRSFAQSNVLTAKQRKDISTIINLYSKAREEQDTSLLKKILTTDVDQLVSDGEWRKGMAAAVAGMQKSSVSRPGERVLEIDNIRLLNSITALVDCKYIIQNNDGSKRNMWSSFILVETKKQWKISAIRNMLPSK